MFGPPSALVAMPSTSACDDSRKRVTMLVDELPDVANAAAGNGRQVVKSFRAYSPVDPSYRLVSAIRSSRVGPAIGLADLSGHRTLVLGLVSALPPGSLLVSGSTHANTAVVFARAGPPGQCEKSPRAARRLDRSINTNDKTVSARPKNHADTPATAICPGRWQWSAERLGGHGPRAAVRVRWAGSPTASLSPPTIPSRANDRPAAQRGGGPQSQLTRR